MKQTWLILLTFLFCLGSFSIYAEETEAGAAVLTLPSFSGGGGPEYTITIEDPQIVSYTCRTEYDDPDQEPMPGAGYEQLELTVVAGNKSAISIYRKAGFVEFGRNPRGFKSRINGYQEVIYMRKELI